MRYSSDVAYYADGSPYSYLGADGALNVGWLHAAHGFPTGESVPALVSNLVRLCREPVNVKRGWHSCELCQRHRSATSLGPTVVHDADGDLRVGHAEIRVHANDGVTFAAPDMIVHYVLAHRYLPPEAFVEAVVAAA